MFSSQLSTELLNRYHEVTDTKNLTQLSQENVKRILEKHCTTFAFSTLAANLLDESIELKAPALALYLLENLSGLCFHHNSTVYEVLKSLGYTVKLVACRFKRSESDEYYPIETHAAIILTLPEGEYLIDPGLGFGVTELIPLVATTEKPAGSYHLFQQSAKQFLLIDANSKPLYLFDTLPITLDVFQKCLPLFKGEDEFTEQGKLVRQGHLFYSLFFYSKLIDKKLESTSALITKRQKTVKAEGSVYDTLITSFKPAEWVKVRLKEGQFANGELKKLVFGDN